VRSVIDSAVDIIRVNQRISAIPFCLRFIQILNEPCCQFGVLRESKSYRPILVC
jgi:hypothetical protein